MAETINAYCSICGKGYHVCNSCTDQKSFMPWRTVTDTIEHYKIYLALHGYTITRDKKEAKKMLSVCDLSDKESFNKDVVTALNNILKDDTKQVKIEKKESKEGSKTTILMNSEDV